MDGRAWVMVGIWIIVGTLYVLVMRNYNRKKREHDQCLLFVFPCGRMLPTYQLDGTSRLRYSQ